MFVELLAFNAWHTLKDNTNRQKSWLQGDEGSVAQTGVVIQVVKTRVVQWGELVVDGRWDWQSVEDGCSTVCCFIILRF